MKLTEEEYAELRHILTERVEEMAEATASWVDINEDNAQRIITGIDDCDPEILDMLPGLDWSGQWADGPNWNKELHSAILSVLEGDEKRTAEALKSDDYDDIFNEICEQHANDVIENEIVRRAKLYL